MKTKKVLSLILSASLAVGILSGCGSASKAASTGTAKKVTVNIFQFKVEFKDAFEAATKAYEAKHSNVKINVTTVGGGEDYSAALKAKFNSGDEPDVFNIGGPSDLQTWKAKLADLTDTNSAKNALDGTLQGASLDGKVYGLPYNVEGYGIIYNKELLKKAGIDTTSINTFDKLTEAVKTLDSKKKELGIQAVFAFPCNNRQTGF